MSSGPEDLWPPFGHAWRGGRPGVGRPGDGGRPSDRPGDRHGGGRDPRDPRGGQAARRASGREIGGRGHRHRSSLSQAEIVDAAIAVADAEGAAAISMRRIAQVLQAGTMSLYWHVDEQGAPARPDAGHGSGRDRGAGRGRRLAGRAAGHRVQPAGPCCTGTGG